MKHPKIIIFPWDECYIEREAIQSSQWRNFLKQFFINVGKNIVTQNFYSIKKKKFRYWKKNVILIWLQSVQKLMYPTWIIHLIGRHLKKTMSDIPVQHALIQ